MLNEEGLAAEFCARVAAALADLPFEIVVVDDGSTDATPAILDELAEADPRIRVLHLSRPFGHQMALTAGLDHARGDAVVMIDADLQDPPELIPELLERWREGADIVVAKRREREGETRFKLATARWFYALMGRLAQVELEPNAGDFRLFDRGPLDALLRAARAQALPARDELVGRLPRATSSSTTAPRAPPARRSSRSAQDAALRARRRRRRSRTSRSSSRRSPASSARSLALLGLPLTIVARYSGIYERGVPSLLFAVLLIGGIQLMALGLIGEYLGRIYDEVKRRPLYVVARARNSTPRRAPRRRWPGSTAATTVRVAVIGAGVAGLVCAHRLGRGGPRVRRLRALARARRPGRDARRRRRPPARALLPPPVHERPPHRRALRRARDARRARVAAVVDGVLRRRPLVAVHDARWTCCASGRSRRAARLRMGLAVLWLQRTARDGRAVRGR